MRRVVLKSPVLENCTPGSVRGAPGNRRLYLAKIPGSRNFLSACRAIRPPLLQQLSSQPASELDFGLRSSAFGFPPSPRPRHLRREQRAVFGFRVSDFFRPSVFGLRISPHPPPLAPGNPRVHFQLCPDCQVQRLLYNRSQRCAILSVIGWSRFEAGFPISGLSPDGFCFLLSVLPRAFRHWMFEVRSWTPNFSFSAFSICLCQFLL